ncbi:hypothetical protein [Methylobacterium oxalidis]|uniref:Uncharacterized protein n=1 Tax=Methylobacterium oxalidis TaxID=944322 RepID=A0A512JAP1_9HYPH|nr:hypothetical protein [Methylobacterium oxalidis]GEP07012.1 hypothetical protein MOX02_50500 [Methylobacterium oxalidis]GJE29844.1 hypothetical protein LDDCCGHA_0006 [Methylobacterium oxalidis]GLS64635.1 hypothetical protein GCM10007888_30160 [Methylobacterium oxalidis]
MRIATVVSLLSSGEIPSADVTAAVETYLSQRTPTLFPLGREDELDLAAAVAANQFSMRLLTLRNCGTAARRAAVRTAIIQARPEKRLTEQQDAERSPLAT